jgi:hypothetical protein
VKKAVEKSTEKTGIPGFLLKGLAVSVFIPAVISAAGFLSYIPYLNLAGAVLAVPLACALLYRVFSNKLRVGVPFTRVLTGFLSLICAWVFLCVMTGTLSGVYGWEPLTRAEMLDFELTDILERWEAICINSLVYLYSPARLFEDLAAWNSEGWLTLAAAGFISQTALPQLLVKRRR